jgi:hypothetical protein
MFWLIECDIDNTKKIKAEQIIRQNSDNLDIIKVEIENNYKAFKHVSNRLKNDFNFVRYIVSKDGELIKFASNYLQNNFIIASIAIRNKSSAYNFISNRLKNNHDIISLVSQSSDGNIIEFIEPHLITEHIIENFLDNSIISSKFISFIPEKFLTKKIIMKILNKSPVSLCKISLELIDDDIILNMIKNNHIDYLKEYNIQITNTLLIIEALKINFKYIDNVSKELLNDKQFVLKIVAINGDFILKVSTELQNNRDIIICAINHSKKLIKYNNILLYNQVWNIQWNFDKFEKNFIEILENIKYMPFTDNIGKLLHIILSDDDFKKIIIDNYNKYLHDVIIYNEDYIIFFQKYNILFFSMIEVRLLDTNINDDEIKAYYKDTLYPNKIILWLE